MLTVLADLLLPSRCVACPSKDGPLCRSCRPALTHPRRHRPDPAPPGLPPIAVAAAYGGPVRAAVLAYKERARRDLTEVLGEALAVAVLEVLDGRAGSSPPVRLVPVPSGSSAARRRGGQHVDRLSDVAVRALGRGGVRAVVLPMLRLAGRPGDSVALSAAERAAAALGKFEIHHAGLPNRRGPATGRGHWVVVDDVVTTGNTLAAACHALTAAGVPVAGAAAVAATRRWNEMGGIRHGQ